MDEATWKRREAARLRQILIGKARPEYKKFHSLFPKDKRTPSDLSTPNVCERVSKRTFDKKLKIWRRQLHSYDDLGNLENVKENLPEIPAWVFPNTHDSDASTNLNSSDEFQRCDTPAKTQEISSSQLFFCASTPPSRMHPCVSRTPSPPSKVRPQRLLSATQKLQSTTDQQLCEVSCLQDFSVPLTPRNCEMDRVDSTPPRTATPILRPSNIFSRTPSPGANLHPVMMQYKMWGPQYVLFPGSHASV